MKRVYTVHKFEIIYQYFIYTGVDVRFGPLLSKSSTQ
jgi:hypothetical protein